MLHDLLQTGHTSLSSIRFWSPFYIGCVSYVSSFSNHFLSSYLLLNSHQLKMLSYSIMPLPHWATPYFFMSQMNWHSIFALDYKLAPLGQVGLNPSPSSPLQTLSTVSLPSRSQPEEIALVFVVTNFVIPGMGRQPCCDKVGLKRGPWTIDEDQKLMSFIMNNGIHCWRAVPKLAGHP